MKITNLVLALILLSGCAFTSGTIHLDYQPPSSSAHFDAKKTVKMGDFFDERGKDPLLLANKVNGYSGAYLAEHPVAEILKESIRESLQSSGVTVKDDSADLLLRARLIRFSFENQMGLFANTIILHIQMEFTMYDGKTGAILWKEMLVANGNKRSGSMFAEDFIKPSFAEATNDLIKKFLALPPLKGSVEGS